MQIKNEKCKQQVSYFFFFLKYTLSAYWQALKYGWSRKNFLRWLMNSHWYITTAEREREKNFRLLINHYLYDIPIWKRIPKCFKGEKNETPCTPKKVGIHRISFINCLFRCNWFHIKNISAHGNWRSTYQNQNTIFQPTSTKKIRSKLKSKM